MIIKFIKSLIRGSILGLIFSLFLFLSIPSCQTMSRKNDPRLKPYIDTFLSLCSKYKKNCSSWKTYRYLIMPMPKTLFDIIKTDKTVTIGRCNRLTNTIIIDENYFNKEIEPHIESTVIHEFGHCVLKKSHVTDDFPAIMNPMAISSWFYVKYYQQLMNDFFNCKKNCPEVKFNIYNYPER